MAIFERFVTALAWAAATLFVAAGAMLTYEVVARYFFTAPTRWAAELSQYSLIWGSLIAMAWVLRERRHIAVSAGLSLMSASGRRVADLFALFATLVLAAIVAWYGFEIFLDSFQRGRTTGSLMNLPIWVVELSVPFGFALLAIQSVIELVRTWRHGAPEPGTEHV